jgi:putative heme iron utilization protein
MVAGPATAVGAAERRSYSMSGEARPTPDFDPVATARTLLRTIRAGALATLDPGGGFPFASLVTVATDHDGSPLFLVSRLSAHTLNLEQDPRASLLLAETGKGDPLAYPRLTVAGRAERIAGPRVRDRFLARHPKARLYVDFPDFSFLRLAMAGGHLNGGFARAAGVTGEALRTDLSGADALVAAEGETIARLNADHADLLRLYAVRLAGAPDGAWTASGVDPEGLDLLAGDRTARIDFPERVTDPGALRRVLEALADRARAPDESTGNHSGT